MTPTCNSKAYTLPSLVFAPMRMTNSTFLTVFGVEIYILVLLTGGRFLAPCTDLILHCYRSLNLYRFRCVCMQSIAHVRGSYGISLAVYTISICVMVIWKLLNPTNSFFTIRKSVRDSRHIKITCVSTKVQTVRDASNKAIIIWLTSHTACDFHRLVKMCAYLLKMLKLDFLHICRIASAVPSAAFTLEFFRGKILRVLFDIVYMS